MSDPEQKGLLDHLVELLARGMDALGLNGTRLRWKWNRRKLNLGEAQARASVMFRSARGKHKMCRSCRALVPRGESKCPECGASLSGIRGPGIGRFLGNLLPGASAATSLLLLVNGVLFLLMLTETIRAGHGIGLFGGFPYPITGKYGAAWGAAVFEYGAWWRLVTAMFLHGGLLHFGFNSYVLLQLGPIIEHEFGTERFWIVYVVTGALGNLTHVAISGGGVVGASGAICGLVGLLIAYGSRVHTGTARMLKAAMLRFSMMILIISLLPGVSWQAHLGGFLAGLGLGWIIPTGQFRSRGTQALWQALSLAGVLGVLLSFYRISQGG